MKSSLKQYELIEDFLRGSLEEANTDLLWEDLSADPEFLPFFLENICIDFYIRQAVNQRKGSIHHTSNRTPVRLNEEELHDLEKMCQSLSDKPSNLFDMPLDHLYNEVVAWEKSVLPLHPAELMDPPAPHFWKKYWRIGAKMTGILALLLCIIWLSIDRIREEYKPHPAPMNDYVAKISDIIDAKWIDEKKSFKRGQLLDHDTLDLKSGLVKITFGSGAHVILEGPAQLTISDLLKCWSDQGKLSVHVPPQAIGFQIGTPFANIIDRGTEFYLNIGRDKAEVNVVRGKVDVSSKDLPVRSMVTGDACSLDHWIGYKKATYNPTPFISSDHFNIRRDEYVSKKLIKKQAEDLLLDQDPNILARFDFSQKNELTASNLARAGRSLCSEARFSGCHPTEGIYSGTKAVQLAKKDDAIHFHLENTWKSLSMITTLRIDKPLKLGNIFASSMDEDRKEGTFLWQISKLGFLQFQIIPDQKEKESCYNSDLFFLPSQRGTWATFAVVADSKSRSIRFFCDGKKISEVPWINPIPLKSKNITLGNALHEKTLSNRFLEGAFGDFQLYNRALTDEEIAQRSRL